MLLDIKCSTVTSIAVRLSFDDGSSKNAVISLNDLIDVEYNFNGSRKLFQGKVISISANGIDPKGWYIIVDGSGDFESNQARFSPMSILDINVIRRGDSVKYIETPIDSSGIMGLRVINHGVLQYTCDGFHWADVRFKRPEPSIKDEEGTCSESDDEII